MIIVHADDGRGKSSSLFLHFVRDGRGRCMVVAARQSLGAFAVHLLNSSWCSAKAKKETKMSEDKDCIGKKRKQVCCFLFCVCSIRSLFCLCLTFSRSLSRALSRLLVCVAPYFLRCFARGFLNMLDAG